MWQRNYSADSEWFYIGDDTLKLNSLIDLVFADEQPLYLVTDRHSSKQLSKSETFENTKNLLEKTQFSIWDLNFKKVIEFNKIGVYRIGEQRKD